MIGNVRLLESRIKTHSSLEEMETPRKEVLKDFESDMAVGRRILGNPTRETADSNGKLNQTARP
jgi:hypothetical protein